MTDLILPILSEGAHESPKEGACFMEFVSYLAGEVWSDAPACSDPMLGVFMQRINDQINDPGQRSKLAELIPQVINSRVLYPDFNLYARWATEIVIQARNAGLLKWRRDLTGRRRNWNTEQLDSLMQVGFWVRKTDQVVQTLDNGRAVYRTETISDEDLVTLANIVVGAWRYVITGQDTVYLGKDTFELIESKDDFTEMYAEMNKILEPTS